MQSLYLRLLMLFHWNISKDFLTEVILATGGSK